MAKKSAHPGRQLFDYLNGALDASEGQMIEQHLAACAGCASVADLVRALKIEAGALKQGGLKQGALKQEVSPESETSSPAAFDQHPDVSALASFFYRRSPSPLSRAIAAHVALCSSCAAEIAQYARAERAAVDYNPAQAERGDTA